MYKQITDIIINKKEIFTDKNIKNNEASKKFIILVHDLENILYVKISDFKIAKSPIKLKTVLGSCVAVSLYDKYYKIGGLCHIMLPKKISFSSNKLKFANTAVPIMIKELKKNNIKIENLEAKIIGGAKIYFSRGESVFPDIGNENVLMVKKVLKSYRINIVGEDILGNEGRTVIFDLEDGKIYSKKFSGEIRIL